MMRGKNKKGGGKHGALQNHQDTIRRQTLCARERRRHTETECVRAREMQTDRQRQDTHTDIDTDTDTDTDTEKLLSAFAADSKPCCVETSASKSLMINRD